jgi:GTPase SAR1 family protein
MIRMDPGITQSIANALKSRRFQREPTAALVTAWDGLTRNFDALILAVEEARGQLSQDRQIQGAAAIAGELDRWRSDEELLRSRDEIDRHKRDVAAIRDRAERTTVNIGVVGQTGSGKSTFLRQITNLPDNVIPPANGPRPTTAARSRFMHSRDRAEAEIKLLTWDEFREKYTAPLHAGAGCPGEAPRTSRSFLDYGYRQRLATALDRQDSEAVSPQALLKRLIIAQDSFSSYEELLGAGVRREQLGNLRKYVAYPERDDDNERPYHAVRDVLVYYNFVVDIENLVFVDLPGTGETGLDVDQQFLADLTSEIDVLLHILRPLAGRGRYGKADDEILDLADRVKTGRRREDFIYMVVNEDYRHNTEEDAQEVIQNLWNEAKERAANNHIQLVGGDVSKQEQARDKILIPVLRHLALRLDSMDQAVAGHAARAARKAAADAATVVERLATDVGRWQVDVPPEDLELARKAKDLRNEIAKELEDLSTQYGRRAQAKEPVLEVEQSLAGARRRLADWASARFGAAGGSDWVRDFEKKQAGDAGEYKDDACTEIRQKLRQEFGQVDSSLDAAKRRVHREITAILRQHLGTTLVPEGDETFSTLRYETSGSGLGMMHSALAELAEFRTGYGSIFLRVGRPIVAQITRDKMEAGRATPPPPPPDQPQSRPSPLFRGSHMSAAASGTVLGIGQPQVAATVATVAAALAAAVKIGEAIGPIITQWLYPIPVPDKTAESFRRALADAFDRAVELIAELIRHEASQLTEALAAIVDEFFDGFIHVPMIEYEYAKLCGPHSGELWPGEFGSGTAELSRRLARLAGAAQQTATAARVAAEAASTVMSAVGAAT